MQNSSLLFLSLCLQLANPTVQSQGNSRTVENSPGWPRFNGPNDNAKSPEKNILKVWKKGEPKVLWEIPKGEGYASPAISGEILVLFHRTKGMERIEGRNAVDGTSLWSHEYPVEYEDRYGYSSGPRASPVIDSGFVYAHGVTAWLTCLELETGKLVWSRDLKKEFDIPDYFFGKGSNPLVFQSQVILNLGGKDNACVISLNAKDGSTRWITRDQWGASYSSPVIATIQGQEVCLVFAGGESRPPTGGLLVIDPRQGKTLSRFPWRSSNYESANAVPPIPLGGNRVFLSECYEKGGVILQFTEDFRPEVIWRDSAINLHWMTPIETKGFLYGVSGRHQRGAEVFCLNLKSLELEWKEPIHWMDSLIGRDLRLELFRASFLLVEGKFLCLSELGSLVWVDMDERGWKVISKTQLFFAPGTWTLPALHGGLLYVMQNETDRQSKLGPRLICYDVRK